VGSCLSAPGPQQIRFAAYIEGLAEAAGHADRRLPLKNYCMGLLLPGQRKSIEPIAARLAPLSAGSALPNSAISSGGLHRSAAQATAKPVC